ncbi:unnamed protein product [Phytophthora fragariaefolia]|uniref:Unnamed protein product n=1 Tax=Phytophthora fragariaefolia TaxID=1490495 RepID=A0A9W6XKG8_9STRA|nr:unnamed protein product [Phytophthora fragariaefolia]
MKEPAKEKRCENGDNADNDIENAFTNLVARWLVKGANGEWKLALKKTPNREELLRPVVRCKINSRARLSSKLTKASSSVVTQENTASCHTRTCKKLTKDFLKRSKELAILEPATIHQHSTVADRPPSNLQRNQKAPAKRKRTDEVTIDLKRECVEEKNAPPVVVARKTLKRILVLNKNTFSPTESNRPTKPAMCRRDSLPRTPKSETRGAQVVGKIAGTASQPSSGEADRSDIKNAGTEQVRPTIRRKTTRRLGINDTSDGISMLCNGKKKCKVEGCYRASYQRGLCPEHGGRDKCHVQNCKNYCHTQGSCKTHFGMNSRGPKSSTNSELVSIKRGAEASSKAQGLASSAASSRTGITEAQESPVTEAKKKRLRLQTSQKPSTSWNSSDLPNLFRSAGTKRVRETEERVVDVKREKVECSIPDVVEDRKDPELATDKSPATKPEEAVCKVRGCRQPAHSDGSCRKHEKRKRCKEDGCENLAARGAGGRCSRHGNKACQKKGCTLRARVRGRCSKHGGKYLCREPGCGRTVHLRGLCAAHLREAQTGAPPRGVHSRARVKKDAENGGQPAIPTRRAANH